MKQALFALTLGAVLSVPAQAATIYFNDFEANSTGMSGAGFLASSQGFSAYGFGAQYLRNASAGNPAPSSVLNLSVGGGATGVSLSFSFAAIDSWDGFNCCGPDYFNVKVDGSTIYSKNFDIFGAPSVGPELTTLVFGPNLAVSSWGDQGYTVNLALPDLGAGAHTVEFFASGVVWQAGDDESFAIDNVLVQGQLIPEPASYALMGLGLLGVAAAARRRRVD